MNESHAPFITLGRHLKYVREQAKESLAEAAGSVEIEEESLQRIEAGQERPAEDILLLLINHFGVQDHEAVQLWELADYDKDAPEQIRPDTEIPGGQKSVVMLIGLDLRTMYSDGLDIAVTPGGLTLSFTQSTGPSKSTPIARVGMGYEQAEAMLVAFQQALLQAKYIRGPKGLPPPSDETA
jgi:DNA-binding XRE family transcriptional regulator